MSTFLKALLVVAATAVLSTPAMAESGSGNETNNTMACTISVEYKRANVTTLVYARDFVVSPGTPYSDDFSTSTRLRFFDASVENVNGTPEVAFVFDADVDVFNAVNFGAVLKVHDESKGETLSGNSSFFGSGVGSHRSFYTLTCKRA